MRRLELLLATALLIGGLATALTANPDGSPVAVAGRTLVAVCLTALALHLMLYGLASVLRDCGLGALARRLQRD